MALKLSLCNKIKLRDCTLKRLSLVTHCLRRIRRKLSAARPECASAAIKISLKAKTAAFDNRQKVGKAVAAHEKKTLSIWNQWRPHGLRHLGAGPQLSLSNCP